MSSGVRRSLFEVESTASQSAPHSSLSWGYQVHDNNAVCSITISDNILLIKHKTEGAKSLTCTKYLQRETLHLTPSAQLAPFNMKEQRLYSKTMLSSLSSL